MGTRIPTCIWSIRAPNDCDYDEFNRDGLIKAGEPVHDMWLRFTIDLDFLIHDVQATSDQPLQAELEEREAERGVRKNPPIIDTCLALSSSGEMVKNRWPELYTPKSGEESQS